MSITLYFLIGFIIFFFCYKKYQPKLKERLTEYNVWADYNEFWIMVLIPLFWPAALPMMGLWIFLDWIYKKINK